MNNTALAATTHRGLKEVSDGMGTQVGIQIINECKVQMIRKELYNVEETQEEGAKKKREEREREHCSILNNLNIVISI